MNRKDLTENSLHESPSEILRERNYLLDKQSELESNLNSAIHLCYNVIKNYYPILVLRTQFVVELCKLVQEQNYFTPAEYKCLEVSAYLYNLGLIKISREILAKYMKYPEELSKNEMQEIQKSPEYSEELVGIVNPLE